MPWLTPIVFKQAADEALVRLPRFLDGPKSVRFRHIIHAYRDHELPQNTSVQAITFQSVVQAAAYAGPNCPVDCVAVTFPEDRDLVPEGIHVASPLERSVSDVALFQEHRHLPLLFDVLRHGAAAPVANHASGAGCTTLSDYIILTNSDIHLQPTFYTVLAGLIHEGYDVITVNRRTLDVSVEDRIFSPRFLADYGGDHPGFDCFVFPRTMLDSFISSDSCCGAGHVMRSLLYNLVAHAQRFLMLTQAHLTYHLGDDKLWDAERFSDYIDHNIAQGRSVVAALAQDPQKATRLMEFISAHEPPMYDEAWIAAG